jgi:hypothetical protein
MNIFAALSPQKGKNAVASVSLVASAWDGAD